MISVVINSVDNAKCLRAAQMYERLLRSTDFEVLAVRDATGMSEGYNRGLAQTRGDLIIFSHDDVEFLAPDFLNRLLGHMNHCDVLGIAGTRRLTDPDWLQPGLPYAYGQVAYPNHTETGQYAIVIWSIPTRRIDHIQAMDGVFLCVQRPVAQQLQFDQLNFTGFHMYDVDFTFRAYLAGFKCAVAADLCPVHSSCGDQGQPWREAATRLAAKFSGRFAPPVAWAFRNAMMVVPTLNEVIQVMNPPHWDDRPTSMNLTPAPKLSSPGFEFHRDIPGSPPRVIPGP